MLCIPFVFISSRRAGGGSDAAVSRIPPRGMLVMLLYARIMSHTRYDVYICKEVQQCNTLS